MTRIPLKEKCGMCNSYAWCGKPCKHAPKTDIVIPISKPAVPKHQVRAPKVQVEAKKRQVATPDKPKFDRNEYHRKYMRDRMRRKRAEDKLIARGKALTEAANKEAKP